MMWMARARRKSGEMLASPTPLQAEAPFTRGQSKDIDTGRVQHVGAAFKDTTIAAIATIDTNTTSRACENVLCTHRS